MKDPVAEFVTEVKTGVVEELKFPIIGPLFWEFETVIVQDTVTVVRVKRPPFIIEIIAPIFKLDEIVPATIKVLIVMEEEVE